MDVLPFYKATNTNRDIVVMFIAIGGNEDDLRFHQKSTIFWQKSIKTGTFRWELWDRHLNATE